MLVCLKSDNNSYYHNNSSVNMTSENINDINPYKTTRRTRPLRRTKHEAQHLEQGASSQHEINHLTNGFEKHGYTSNQEVQPKPLKSHQQIEHSNSKPASEVNAKANDVDRAREYTRHLLNRNFQLEKNDSASEFVRAIISAVDDMNDHNISLCKIHSKHEEKVHAPRKHTKHKSSDLSKKKSHAHKDHSHNLNSTEPKTDGLQNNNIEPNDSFTNWHDNNDASTRKFEHTNASTSKLNLKNKKLIANEFSTTSLTNLSNKRSVSSPKTNRRLIHSNRVLHQVPEIDSPGENQVTSKYSSLIRYLNNVPEHEHQEEENLEDGDAKQNTMIADTNEVNPAYQTKYQNFKVIPQNDTHENSQNSSEKSNREDCESNWQPAVTDRHTEEGLDTDKPSQHVPLMFQRRRRSRNEDYCRVRSSDGRPLTASEMRYYRRRPIISPADSRSTNTSLDDDSNNSRTRRRRPVQPWHHLQSDSDCAMQRRMLHNAIQEKAASVRIHLVHLLVPLPK